MRKHIYEKVYHLFQEAGFDLASLGESWWLQKLKRHLRNTERTLAMLSCPSTPCPYKPDKSVLPCKHEIVLSLASPAHPRLKADRLSRPIFARFCLWDKADAETLHEVTLVTQLVQLLLKEHPFRESLLWHLCSRGIKIQKLHPLEKPNHVSSCSSAIGHVSSHSSHHVWLNWCRAAQVTDFAWGALFFPLEFVLSHTCVLAFRCCKNPWIAFHISTQPHKFKVYLKFVRLQKCLLSTTSTKGKKATLKQTRQGCIVLSLVSDVEGGHFRNQRLYKIRIRRF